MSWHNPVEGWDVPHGFWDPDPPDPDEDSFLEMAEQRVEMQECLRDEVDAMTFNKIVQAEWHAAIEQHRKQDAEKRKNLSDKIAEADQVVLYDERGGDEPLDDDMRNQIVFALRGFASAYEHCARICQNFKPNMEDGRKNQDQLAELIRAYARRGDGQS